MGIDARHIKYSTWEVAAKLKRFAKGFTPADTSMRFEYPVIADYPGYPGAGTQAVDFDERINYERMKNYRLERVREQLKANNAGISHINS